MSYIFVHGLGQRENSWNQVLNQLGLSDAVVSPNLTKLIIDEEMSYLNLYKSFSDRCNQYEGSLNLCGLSLGSILCLNYAMDNPEKVATLTLVAPQYKIPKLVFQFQNLVFKLMPKTFFKQMGFSKKNTLALTKSMTHLDFTENLHKVNCPTLILCGSKDAGNLKASRKLTEMIGHSEFKIIENAKHEVNIENPDELSSEIRSFYKKARE